MWTNNGRRVAENALTRCGLRAFFAAVVTRDEAALKPDPAGLRLLEQAFPDRRIWVVGDSWVDGAAAKAGGPAAGASRAAFAAMQNQEDAPPCSTCGSIMVRSGACYKCANCGTTSGCA